jgi:hypothetical protein
MSLYQHAVIVAAVVILCCCRLCAQSDNDDVQSWNDVTLTKPLSKTIDLYIPATIRFANDLSRFNEWRLGGGIGFKLHPRFSTAATYTYIRARSSSGAFRGENRIAVRGVYRFTTKPVAISHRSQFEYRIRSSGNTWRYRPSVTVDVPVKWLGDTHAFVTEEPFYDSATGRFSRNRISFGVSKPINKNLALDVYYLRQDDGNSRPAVLHVIGTGWRVKL